VCGLDSSAKAISAAFAALGISAALLLIAFLYAEGGLGHAAGLEVRWGRDDLSIAREWFFKFKTL